jgi:hypothetical protein
MLSPNGYKCDIEDGKCIAANSSLPILKKMKSKKINEQNEKCNNDSECAPGSTCCILKSGMYGCCPLPDAGITKYYI